MLDLCPIRVYEPFSTARTSGWKRGNAKNPDRKKCWEAKPSSLFFPQQRQTGIFHFHLTSEICRLKKASTDWG